jgi:methyl-accepting chemotaxis protein
MSLKTRFTVFAIIPALLISIAVLVANSVVYRQAEASFEAVTLRGKMAIWHTILTNENNQLRSGMRFLTRDRSSLRALVEGDLAAVGDNVVTTYNQLSGNQRDGNGILDNIQIVEPGGKIIFSARDGFTGKTDNALIQAALADRVIQAGITRDNSGRLVSMLAFPLYHSGQMAGVGVYTQNLEHVIRNFAENDGSDVVITGVDGTAEYATNRKLLQELNLDWPALEEELVLTRGIGEGIFAVSVQPIKNASGKPLARLISISDSTEISTAKRNTKLGSIAVVLASILVGLVFLLLYTRRAFRPLDGLMEAVHKISHGDTSARTSVSGSDEFGQLGSAFNNMAQGIQDSIEREQSEKEELNGKVELILDVLSRVTRGDLTAEMMVFSGEDKVDELARQIDSMIRGLNQLVSKVQQSGIQVTSSTNEIAATARQQEATVTEQAATTNEITATVQEISATAKDLAMTMDEISKVADTTAESASDGHSALSRMENTMTQMRDATTSITSKLSVLSEKAANINSVVTTITKVADQTNLLSLNAAIEAEKAGEYGAGFSVVATEIRRLADQTAVATWDIEQMVKEMQSAVSAGVMGMDKFTEEVRRGVDEVRGIGGQLADIIEQVQALSPRFDNVSEGMQSQATGANQISESISQLSDGAQQTADSLRQSNLTIQQLKEAAELLQEGVSQFKLST